MEDKDYKNRRFAVIKIEQKKNLNNPVILCVNMVKSLLQVVQEIDVSPKFATREEKDQAIRREFEQRRTNSMVRARFDGTSFLDTYLRIFRDYNSVHSGNSYNTTESLLDGYKQTVNTTREIGELAECFLDLEQRHDYFNRKIDSGMAIGGTGGLIMSLILLRSYRTGNTAENLPVQLPLFANPDDVQSEDTLVDKSNGAMKKLSRRDILLKGFIVTSGMASLGGHMMSCDASETVGIDLAYQNVKYLDDTYQRIFLSKSAGAEPTQTDRKGFFDALYKRA